MKKCSKCKKTKPLKEFVKDVNCPNGYRSYCKICNNKLATQNRRTRRTRLGTIEVHSKECQSCKRDLPASEYHSFIDSRDGLQSKCKSCVRTLRQKKRSENPDHYYGIRLERVFGISLEEYQEMEKNQDYKCAICNTTDPGTRKSKGALKSHFAVDHDHQTGEIRGLLCSKCNAAIGLLGDNLEGLEAATAYLRKHKHGH